LRLLLTVTAKISNIRFSYRQSQDDAPIVLHIP